MLILDVYGKLQINLHVLKFRKLINENLLGVSSLTRPQNFHLTVIKQSKPHTHMYTVNHYYKQLIW